MKNSIILSVLICFFLSSCKQKSNSKYDIILPSSTGNTNQILVVMKSGEWQSAIGDAIRNVFGEHQVGLPQPETLLNVTQIDPSGFKGFVENTRSVLILQKGAKEEITIARDKNSRPQIIITATAKDEFDIINLIKTRGKEIIRTFKDEDIKFTQNVFRKTQFDANQFKTLKTLGITLTIPEKFKLVDDTGDFLWLRNHLTSGIARGTGSNNILVYSVPLEDETKVVENITTVRDSIGKKFIPGSKEGMYMITEQAYTPFTYDIKIDGKKAYETRGKWEVKNDFMAGPFVNYTVIDKKNNRLVIFEGFTYAPSVNKRDLLFELEAIGRSMTIK